jgi:hypothetical protein
MELLKSSLIYGERCDANALQAGKFILEKIFFRAATTTEREDAEMRCNSLYLREVNRKREIRRGFSATLTK